MASLPPPPPRTFFFTGVQAAILVHKKQCPKFWKFVCDVFSALIFPGMLILFIGCELHYSYYERALPYCLAVGLFLLALTTASYFYTIRTAVHAAGWEMPKA